jgi:hypothetical protein
MEGKGRENRSSGQVRQTGTGKEEQPEKGEDNQDAESLRSHGKRIFKRILCRMMLKENEKRTIKSQWNFLFINAYLLNCPDVI